MKYFVFLLAILTCSCETVSRIKKSDINPVTSKFAGMYDTKPFLIKARHEITKKDSSITAIDLFDTSKTRKSDLDFIQINFNTKGQLNLYHKDTSAFQPITLDGRFSKKGYYEIYFRNEKTEIPPVVHFLFSKHNIKRLRIYETKNNDLIVYYYSYFSGNFLLVGGGGPDKKQFFFNKIR